MKKWFVLLLATCFTVAVHAQSDTAGAGATNKVDKAKGKPITKAQYIENQKMRAEKAGKDFDQAAAEAKFNELDKNKDGMLTADERGKPKKKAKKVPEKSEDGDESAQEATD
jgi:hypothetical protein